MSERECIAVLGGWTGIVLEGIDNKFKVIKRLAYGFRDDAYFSLETRAAFPGVS